MAEFPPHVEIPEDVVSEVLEGQAVILNLRTGTYYSLNPTGTRLWELLEKDGNFARARETMLREYEVTSEVLDADLHAVVDELLDRSLLAIKARP